MSERDTPGVVPLMVGTSLPLAPVYVDAFLDRGKRGDEPQIHTVLAGTRCEGWSASAHPWTIERPGSTAWPGFAQRASALALVGHLALDQGPFHTDRSQNRAWDEIDYLRGGDLMRALRTLIAPEDRAWGRATRAAQANGGMWSLAGVYAASCFFPWPKDTHDLPWVADVVAHPTPLLAPLVPALLQAVASLPDTHRAKARLLPVWGLDMASAHQAMATMREARAAVSTTLQERHHLRGVGGLSPLVTTPVLLEGFDVVGFARSLKT